ncbi:MAG: hypothetical protein JXB34_05115 [Bacteroidales bacterium]|nr:hypothetical protein [Bacteroidales bacterium]
MENLNTVDDLISIDEMVNDYLFTDCLLRTEFLVGSDFKRSRKLVWADFI